ncbi:hypothetical protein DZK25_02945 [Wenzhouxiangella sp. 15181]|nr:hypothetical protein DZK25_02945 [Wenzhouxiangella sp. 15181]RFP70026.1 hypothetical protein DZK26_02045 [Wenzhouxiangella sp. 15190]
MSSLVRWFAGWLVGWLAGWLVGWFGSRSVCGAASPRSMTGALITSRMMPGLTRRSRTARRAVTELANQQTSQPANKSPTATSANEPRPGRNRQGRRQPPASMSLAM